MKASTITIAFCLAALAVSCSMLKRGAWTGGGAAGGAALGSLAGPVGTVAGAAAGGIAGQAIGENDELRDGDLIGKKAAKEYVFVDRPYSVPVPEPFIPAWVKWGAVLAFLLLKGHHILNFLRGGGVESLLKLVGLKRTIIPKKTRADVIRRMEST